MKVRIETVIAILCALVAGVVTANDAITCDGNAKLPTPGGFDKKYVGLFFDVRFSGSPLAHTSVSLFVLFGLTSLLAYLCEEAFHPVFMAFRQMFEPGFAHVFGAWAGPLAGWLASTVFLIAIGGFQRMPFLVGRLHSWNASSRNNQTWQ